uniref:Uncharacterized protein n=1 Tax=Anopheles minimus TaxID=112268 RepID=A0A182WI97_9DIPT
MSKTVHVSIGKNDKLKSFVPMGKEGRLGGPPLPPPPPSAPITDPSMPGLKGVMMAWNAPKINEA